MVEFISGIGRDWIFMNESHDEERRNEIKWPDERKQVGISAAGKSRGAWRPTSAHDAGARSSA
eukprot:m.840435 g.840435  ORF g.840435 m.840435 type:complete len:63 (-) comp59511_c0_seq2:52-240(-)